MLSIWYRVKAGTLSCQPDSCVVALVSFKGLLKSIAFVGGYTHQESKVAGLLLSRNKVGGGPECLAPGEDAVLPYGSVSALAAVDECHRSDRIPKTLRSQCKIPKSRDIDFLLATSTTGVVDVSRCPRAEAIDPSLINRWDRWTDG